MPLLQRYILSELLRVFLFTISVLTVLLVFVGVFAQAQERGLGPAQALQILPYVVPSMLPFTLPSTLLLTVCVVYGRLAGDLEITAMKAAGVGLMTMLWPALWLGAAMSAASFYAMDQLTPWAMENIERTVGEAMEDIFIDMLRTKHQFVDHQHGVAISVLDVEMRPPLEDDEEERRVLIMPTFQYSAPGKDPVTIQASEAEIKIDVANREVHLHLVEGYLSIPGQDEAYFKEEARVFPLPESVQDTKPRWMSTARIKDEMATLKGETHRDEIRHRLGLGFALALGEFPTLHSPKHAEYHFKQHGAIRTVHKMGAEIWSRLAMAFSCFGFVLVGAPTAIWQGKKQFFSTFFVCFMPILLGYYPVVLLSLSLCKNGKAAPEVMMWSGDGLLLIAGFLLLRRVLKN